MQTKEKNRFELAPHLQELLTQSIKGAEERLSEPMMEQLRAYARSE